MYVSARVKALFHAENLGQMTIYEQFVDTHISVMLLQFTNNLFHNIQT